MSIVLKNTVNGLGRESVIAEGITKAYENGAALVVLPILFAEKDRLGGDEVFINTLNQYPVVTSQSASKKGRV
jgi:hypothetical protein